MDKMLCNYREYAKYYINNIIIFFKTFNNYLRYFRTIFSLFVKKKFSLKSKKSFVGYPLINLLGKKVDIFGLFTIEKKVKIIQKIAMPMYFADLESYFNLTNYLKKSIG